VVDEVDFPFDRGFISLGDKRVLVSPVVDDQRLVQARRRSRSTSRRSVPFDAAQERFLEFHWAEIFRDASAKKKGAA